MPIFEYRCKQCDCDFETLVWSSQENQLPRCPKCRGKEVERILSCFSKAGSASGTDKSSSCGSHSHSGGFS